MLEFNDTDKQKCVEANIAYEGGDFERVMTILNNDEIKRLPCALHNKGFFCYTEDYTEDKGLSSIEYSKKLLAASLDIANYNLKTHLLLGKINFEEQNYELSAKEFNTAVNLCPNTVALNNLGVVLHFLNRNSESENYYKRSLEMDFNSISAYNLALEYALKNSNKCESLISQINLCDDVDCIDIARIYFLIDNYEMVCKNFNLMWDDMLPDVLDYSIYLYSLKKMNLINKYNMVKDEAKKLIKEYISDFDSDDAITAYTKLFNDLNIVDIQLEKNHKPTIILNPKMMDCCYLYYCVVHDNSD